MSGKRLTAEHSEFSEVQSINAGVSRKVQPHFAASLVFAGFYN